jgi:CO/xanthine dehydrogenase Mo-binding subunit
VLAHPPGQRQSDFPVLPADRAVYAGQPVAAVVAENRYAAEDALAAVRVDWDPQPTLTDVVQATAPGARRLYQAWPDNVAVSREIGPGIPEGVFESAHTVVEATFTTPRQTAAPLEGRAICASWDAGTGVLTVSASSQAPHQFRTVLAGILGLDEERVRVVVPDVGGGFGVNQPENWTHPYGVHVAVVEVSRDRGAVAVLGYWVTHDCGTLLNLMLVDGQLAGGVAQGLGGALLEHLPYDENGQPLCRTFMEYALPTAAVMPPLVFEHLETPSPHTPGGMKGMAEGGTIAAPPTIASAVADALAGAGVPREAVSFYPLTPARVFALLNGRR